MKLDAVVCFFWFDPKHPKAHVYTYTPEHVRRLRHQVMFGKGMLHFTGAEFICVSDRPMDGVKTTPLPWTKFVAGTRFAKLCMFDPVGPLAGMRFLYLDLDCVVTGNLMPLVQRDEGLVLWRNPNYGQPGRAFFNTSIILHTGGRNPELYEQFEGIQTLQRVQQATGWGGTDQAWVSYRCPDREHQPHWTQDDGVYGAGRLRAAAGVRGDVYSELPANARIVFTPGARTPWTPGFQEQHPWAAEYEVA